MSNEKMGIKIKAIAKVDKYPEGVSQEDILSGKIKPYETVFSEELITLSEQEYKQLFNN